MAIFPVVWEWPPRVRIFEVSSQYRSYLIVQNHYPTACNHCTEERISCGNDVDNNLETITAQLNGPLPKRGGAYRSPWKKNPDKQSENRCDDQRLKSMFLMTITPPPPLQLPRSGELRTQKLKSHLVRTQGLNVLPLKPGVGQHMAIHATLTIRDFFHAYFYPSGPFTCIFSKTSPPRFFFLCWLWLTPVPV